MSWGISPNASEKEKLKARFNDHLQGMNSCGEIDYIAYSKLYDVCIPILEECYDRMEKERAEDEESNAYTMSIRNCKKCICEKCDHFEFDCVGLCFVCDKANKSECADYVPVEGSDSDATD